MNVVKAQSLNHDKDSSPAAQISPKERSLFEATLRLTVLGFELDLVSALQLMAEETTRFTGASGTAIAIEKEQGIECCASAGEAPGVGAIVNPNSGLSGECVCTGRAVRCEDAESDPRVTPTLFQSLHFRSALIVPIISDQRTIGIIEVLAEQSHHFNHEHALLISSLADLVLELIKRENKKAQSGEALPEPEDFVSTAFVSSDVNRGTALKRLMTRMRSWVSPR